MPRVSAIVPTCNRPEMAAQALQSIVSQTKPPDEIILADDGDDGAGESLAQQYKTKLIVTDRVGPARARNQAIEAASGDWLAFCDDDDIWLPMKLERQLTAIGSQTALLYSDAFDNAGNSILSRHDPREGYAFPSLLLDNWISTSSVLLRRDAWQRAGGFEDRFCPAEDYRLWLRISLFGSLTRLEEPLVSYRSHPGQLQKNVAKMSDATAAVILDALAEVGWREQQIPNLARRLRQLRFMQGRALMSQRQAVKARTAYYQAWQHQRAYLKAPAFFFLSYLGI